MSDTIQKAEQNYQQRCACAEDAFCRFIRDRSRFSVEDKAYLTRIIIHHEISGFLYVSSVLAGWSVVAGIIDAILFPGIIVYAIFHGAIDYKVLTPPLLFLIGNGIAKFFFIYSNLRHHIRFWEVLIAILPYAGSAYLLKKFLVGDVLLREGVLGFLAERKKVVKDHIKSFLRLN
ncbi:MAG: hypothetical protein ACEPOZ_00535 [Marinifilaceae bacterium]